MGDAAGSGNMMITCKEAARLMSEDLDHDLRFRHKLELKLHLAMCTVCRAVKKQFHYLRRIAHALGASGPDSLIAEGALVNKALSSDAKSRIEAQLSRGS